MSDPRKELADFESQYTIIDWDWKESLPVAPLQAAILTGHLWLYTVDNTHSDSYAIIAANRVLEPGEVQPLYDRWEQLIVAESELVQQHGS